MRCRPQCKCPWIELQTATNRCFVTVRQQHRCHIHSHGRCAARSQQCACTCSNDQETPDATTVAAQPRAQGQRARHTQCCSAGGVAACSLHSPAGIEAGIAHQQRERACMEVQVRGSTAGTRFVPHNLCSRCPKDNKKFRCPGPHRRSRHLLNIGTFQNIQMARPRNTREEWNPSRCCTDDGRCIDRHC
jgi:hypothetical protein